MSIEYDYSELRDLFKFINDNNVIEIVRRDEHRRYIEFVNARFTDKLKKETNELLDYFSQRFQLEKKTLQQLQKIAGLTELNVMLNGLNLCATCVGFAVMNDKLNKISDKINEKLNQIQKTIKQTQDIQNEFELNKVLALHMDMLDSQRRQKPYSEDQMRDLVDREYNVLSLLIKSLQLDVSDDYETLIVSIISLLSMFTVSLRKFDEIYYFNNRKVLAGSENVWHLSHDKWMNVYDILLSAWFVEKLQDHGFLKIKLSTESVDTYCVSLLDQISNLRETIKDNQALITAIEDKVLFNQLEDLRTTKVKETIRNCYFEAGKGKSEKVIEEEFQYAVRQAALA